MEKSYNQRYKESNTTLSYKEWRKREDEKMASFDGRDYSNKPPQFRTILATADDRAGYQTRTTGRTVLGIPYKYLIVAGALIGGVIAFKIYQRYKK